MQFTVTIKGQDTTLRNIQNTLTGATSDCSPVAEALATIIQQTLKVAGIIDDFKVTLRCRQITFQLEEEGGLSAREWLETGGISD
jgi:hypothetical protein